MRQIQFDRVLILSAELATNSTEENMRLTENLKGCLDDLDIEYKQGIGVYKYSVESSFIVLPKCDTEEQAILALAFDSFKQESVLSQGVDGESSLIYSNWHHEHLGKLRETPKILAQKQDSYTLLNGKYYAIGA
jgi:hypothetical protein